MSDPQLQLSQHTFPYSPGQGLPHWNPQVTWPQSNELATSLSWWTPSQGGSRHFPSPTKGFRQSLTSFFWRLFPTLECSPPSGWSTVLNSPLRFPKPYPQPSAPLGISIFHTIPSPQTSGNIEWTNFFLKNHPYQTITRTSPWLNKSPDVSPSQAIGSPQGNSFHLTVLPYALIFHPNPYLSLITWSPLTLSSLLFPMKLYRLLPCLVICQLCPCPINIGDQVLLCPLD